MIPSAEADPTEGVSMKIGIIGSGDVGRALAEGCLKYGHEVAVGTREPAKLKAWGAQHPKARVVGFGDAAGFGEMVILAVKGTAASDALSLAGRGNLAGKVVVDATNPIA